MTRFLRLDDRPPGAPPAGRGPEAGLAPFAGHWVTTNPSLHGVRRFDLSDGGGGPSVRLLGQVPEGFVDWGTAPVAGRFAGGVGATAAEGFVAAFDLGYARCRLQANLKLGVAVAGAFLETEIGGARSRLFTRDFLSRPPAGEPPPAEALLEPTEERVRRMLGTPAAARFEPFAGRWLNTAESTGGIVRLEIALDAEEATLQLFGAGPEGPIDWGPTEGRVFPCVEEDRIASACILARYDFGFMTSELQVRMNKGILAVTTFNTFEDGSGRASYVKRELFHQ